MLFTIIYQCVWILHNQSNTFVKLNKVNNVRHKDQRSVFNLRYVNWVTLVNQ